jgi:hypothetical protein
VLAVRAPEPPAPCPLPPIFRLWLPGEPSVSLFVSVIIMFTYICHAVEAHSLSTFYSPHHLRHILSSNLALCIDRPDPPTEKKNLDLIAFFNPAASKQLI